VETGYLVQHMVDDRELLRRYAAEGREEAFTELVKRHVNLVYSAALRRVGPDRSLAEEITQNVFIQCARKARALQVHPALSGWLHRSTGFAAIDALRAKRSRIRTEEIESMDPNGTAAFDSEMAWPEARPAIDAFLDGLGERDRAAVVLRFFEGCSFAQIGEKLRLSEDAARMRVDRALEKLRAVLVRRGAVSSTAALGLALTHYGVAAAPSGLAATASAGALAAVGAGTGLLGTGLFMMNRITVGILGALIAGGAATVTFELRANRGLKREIVALRMESAKAGDLSSAVPSARFVREPLGPGTTEADELGRLRARIAELKARPDGVVDSEIKPRATWKDAGHATPEAAIETFIWAAAHDRFDSLAASYVFGEKTKEEADAFFAKLSPEIRAKYETPERLFAPFIVSGAKQREVDAMQVIEVLDGSRPDEAIVRYWVHFPDGKGHEDTLPFQHLAEGWRMGHRAMGISIPAAVEFLRTHVDSGIVEGGARNE
jgi:RNA polymerase sigma factor (sigma-70 family)